MHGEKLSRQATHEDILQRIKTAESVWLPREVFESLYLNPEKRVAGDLRRKVRSWYYPQHILTWP